MCNIVLYRYSKWLSRLNIGCDIDHACYVYFCCYCDKIDETFPKKSRQRLIDGNFLFNSHFF